MLGNVAEATEWFKILHGTICDVGRCWHCYLSCVTYSLGFVCDIGAVESDPKILSRYGRDIIDLVVFFHGLCWVSHRFGVVFLSHRLGSLYVKQDDESQALHNYSDVCRAACSVETAIQYVLMSNVHCCL